MKQYCLALAIAALLKIDTPAIAQLAPYGPPLPPMPAVASGTIIAPGEPPLFINAIPAGGWSVISPGQPPVFITPTGFDGTYAITSPGMDPVFFIPIWVGE